MSDENVELIRKLAHEIKYKAAGTQDRERTWIEKAAWAIERLTQADSTDEDRADARQVLAVVPQSGIS